MSEDCIGFILIKQYPNCRKPLGYFEPFTTGEFLKYSEFWKPVYKSELGSVDINLIESVIIIPPYRLRKLADLLDFIDEKMGYSGNEVQEDLRSLANNIEKLTKLQNG